MSNNIRDFKNMGVSAEESGAEKSNTLFYACVVAIPLIAVAAGLGYKPLMELRSKNVAAVQQAELDLDARRRAENPLYALMNAPKNADGLIDLNKPLFGGGSGSSSSKKSRNPYAKKSMTAKEFLTRLDAKAIGFSSLELETLKYERATSAMSFCRHSDLRKFYVRQNETAYNSLKAKQNAAKDVRRAERTAQAEKLKIPKIENKTQALAFVASGGVARHQENAMGMMMGLDGMMGDLEKSEITRRRQRFNEKGCMQVRTLIQSGSMTVKTNVKLK